MSQRVVTNVTEAVDASQFLNTIGVNIHAATGQGSYLDSTSIVASLSYLGVDTVREHFSATDKSGSVISALGQAGIQFEFVVPSDLPAKGDAALTAYIESIASFVRQNPDSVFAIEGLNEANIQAFSYNGSSSMAANAAYQAELFGQIKGHADLAGVKVIAPSIAYESAAAYAELGDISGISDFGNAHAYTSTETIADQTMEKSMANAAGAVKGKPVVITETGYTTAQSTPYLGVSDLAQAKLTLVSLMNAFENGSQMTFLYELFDSKLDPLGPVSEHNFGLFEADGTPKLAATAMHNLNVILSAQDGGAGGAPLSSITFDSIPDDAHSTILSKDGGVVDLMLWRDASGWNSWTDTDVAVAAQTVTVDLGGVQQTVMVYDPLGGIEPIAVYRNVSEISLLLGDRPLIVEIGARGAVSEPAYAPGSAINLGETAFVSQIATLAEAQGLDAIHLTGDHVLNVATDETMQGILAHYGDVLAKIEGGYSFRVTTHGMGWTLEKDYDASGHLLATIDYGVADGEVISKHVVNADGSTFTARYEDGVMLQSTEVATNGTNVISGYEHGVLTLRTTLSAGSERYEQYQGGVMTSVVVNYGNGSRLIENYDLQGRQLNSITISAQQQWTTLIYDPATGLLQNRFVSNPDGSREASIFNITGQDYTTEVQVINASGKLTELSRYHADGGIAYREVNAADGSKTISIYDSHSILVEAYLIDANGVSVPLEIPAPIPTPDPDPVSTIPTITQKVVGATTYVYLNSKLSYAVEALDATTNLTTSYNAQGQKANDTSTSLDGTVTSRYYDASGHLSQASVRQADGTTQTTTYGITGQTYDRIVKDLDSSGTLTAIKRLHADGTLDSAERYPGDGTRVVETYDAHGALTVKVTISPNGGQVQQNFDAISGQLLKQMQWTASGDVVTSLYSDGKLASQTTVHADGSYVTESLSGESRIQESFDHAGHKVLAVIHDADGTTETLKFSATTGQITQSWVAHEDGSAENSIYGITGQTYVRQVQKVDADGHVSSVERYADHDVPVTITTYGEDGSVSMTSFDSAGHRVSLGVTEADGSHSLLKFDPSTGKVASGSSVSADGAFATSLYDKGVLQATVTAGTDGASKIVHYDVTETTAASQNWISYDSYIAASSGDRHVAGTAGNDVLIANGHNLALSGGLGDDRFVFQPGSGVSSISDFGKGADILDLHAYGVAGLTPVLGTQNGNATLDFGNGDMIILANVDVSHLVASSTTEQLYVLV